MLTKSSIPYSQEKLCRSFTTGLFFCKVTSQFSPPLRSWRSSSRQAVFADRFVPPDQFPAVRTSPEFSLDLATRLGKIDDQQKGREHGTEQAPNNNVSSAIGGHAASHHARHENDQKYQKYRFYVSKHDICLL